MIPIFLVVMGIRVPDFSRPHIPKPMRRAVLDKTPAKTVLQHVAKVVLDPCIINTPAIVAIVTEEYRSEVPPIYLPVPLLLLTPFPPRAPPVPNSLA
jgi:hypothetical protein